MQQKQGNKITKKYATHSFNFQKNLLILIDKSTSSGAEILAALLKSRNRTILLGQRTYGKGSIQKLFKLSSGGGIKLTVAHLLAPDGEVLDKRGVAPDFSTEADPLPMAKKLAKTLAEKFK